METQHQIKRALSQPQAVAWVRQRLEQHSATHRTALADAVCAHFGFYDPGGRPQQGSCLKALRQLEAAGHFTLPPPQGTMGPRHHGGCRRPCPHPRGCRRRWGR